MSPTLATPKPVPKKLGPTIEYQRPWLYPKQHEFLFTPARYAVVEASTKSGKTVGCMVWLFEEAALKGRAGRHYWWVAPTLPVAKIAYRRLKRAIPRHLYKGNDSDATLRLVNGATIWFKGADRPDSLYGEDVFAAVIDEATRCKEEAWHAIRSTLTATKGPVRIIGNVRGRNNWAYSLARKAESGAKDMAYFKLTALDAVEAGVLDAEEIADAERILPADVYKELYLAEASDNGGNPFGSAAIASCVRPAGFFADAGRPICWGWDFARAQDWTVGVGLDHAYRVTGFARWQLVPWGETKRQVLTTNGAVMCWGDSTGVGDVIVEDLQRMGLPMQGVMFTKPRKQQLMERLAVAIQQGQVTFPDGPIRAELEAFEYTYSPSGVTYAAPSGQHDDCVMALALAVFGRDQMGMVAEPGDFPVRPEGMHPGIDPKTGRRRLPSEPVSTPTYFPRYQPTGPMERI